MPEFLCRIGNENGEIVEQIFHATDEKILREDLEKKNCHVFEIKKKGGPLKLSSLPIPGMKKKIKLQNFIIFNQELAVLLKAGLPLLNCLDILIERIEDPVFRDSLQEVRNQVQGGASLSEAFALQGDLYPKLYAPSLTAGERSGELVPVITRFVAYMKKINAIRKKILASLTYPAILITLSIFLVNIVIFYALPKFISFYEEFGEELPLPTTILRNTSIFLRENSLFVIGGIIIAYIAFTIWRNSDQGEVIMDRVKMKLPVLGDVFQIYHISQISRTLSTLIAGGIPDFGVLLQHADYTGEMLAYGDLRVVVADLIGIEIVGGPDVCPSSLKIIVIINMAQVLLSYGNVLDFQQHGLIFFRTMIGHQPKS